MRKVEARAAYADTSSIAVEQATTFEESRERNLVVEKRERRISGTATSLKYLAYALLHTRNVPVGLEEAAPPRLTIRLSERVLEEYEVKDEEEARRIREAMERAEKNRAKARSASGRRLHRPRLTEPPTRGYSLRDPNPSSYQTSTFKEAKNMRPLQPRRTPSEGNKGDGAAPARHS